MSALVIYLTCAYAAVVGGYAAWHSWRGYRFSNPLFYALALLEVVLIAITIGAVVAYGQREHEIEGLLLFSYLATVLVVAPAAVFWGITEKSRWGTATVTLAMITVAALLLRIHGIWEGPANV